MTLNYTRTLRYADCVLSHTYHKEQESVSEALQIGISGLWEKLIEKQS